MLILSSLFPVYMTCFTGQCLDNIATLRSTTCSEVADMICYKHKTFIYEAIAELHIDHVFELFLVTNWLKTLSDDLKKKIRHAPKNSETEMTKSKRILNQKSNLMYVGKDVNRIKHDYMDSTKEFKPLGSLNNLIERHFPTLESRRIGIEKSLGKLLSECTNPAISFVNR